MAHQHAAEYCASCGQPTHLVHHGRTERVKAPRNIRPNVSCGRKRAHDGLGLQASLESVNVNTSQMQVRAARRAPPTAALVIA